MAIKEVAKNLRLNLDRIPEESREQAKQDVGEFVVNQILRFVSSGTSPVEGESFARLTSEYADKFKGGNRTPNLELDGDMLDSLTYEITNNGIEVGIFDASEVPKADGHNNFSGDSKLPTRRFIPKGNQNFRPIIEAGIETVLDRYRTDVTSDLDFLSDIIGGVVTTNVLASDLDVTIDEIIGGL